MQALSTYIIFLTNSTNLITSRVMSALSPALAPTSGVRWADLLTPLESNLTDCCLSYKQSAPVSPLFATLTHSAYLTDSAHFQTPCFDTLAHSFPVSPLVATLTKNTWDGGTTLASLGGCLEAAATYPSPYGVAVA